MAFVLVACEESQRVCAAFREKGHIAYSCDLMPCSGGHPEWHIHGDVLDVLYPPIYFQTMDLMLHKVPKWDLIIAHPPCTYLTVSGNRWFNVERYGDKAIKRYNDREYAIRFFMTFAMLSNCDHIAIENPIGIMSTIYRKPDQIIQPYQFGHPYTKSTCLWLYGLPPLKPTDVLTKPETGWINQAITPDGRYGGFNGKFNGSRERSKTFPGIAKAMADQWSPYLDESSD